MTLPAIWRLLKNWCGLPVISIKDSAGSGKKLRKVVVVLSGGASFQKMKGIGFLP